MAFTIAFSGPTVKTLHQELQAALRLGDGRRSTRIAALLLLADGHPVDTVVARLGVGRSTVYAWCQLSPVNVPPVFGNGVPGLCGNRAPRLFGNGVPPVRLAANLDPPAPSRIRRGFS